MTIITSRNSLAGLVARDGARPMILDPLTGDDADQLVRAILGRQRADAEHACVRQLSQLCGNLPLALRIAAAGLAVEPTRAIATLVRDLNRPGRLAARRQRLIKRGEEFFAR